MSFIKNQSVSISILLIGLLSTVSGFVNGIALEGDVRNISMNNISLIHDNPRNLNREGGNTILRRMADAATDREALIALYESTNGAKWKIKPWDITAPTDTWDGVTTDENGRVTELVLLGRGLDGILPPEIGNLDALKVLSITGETKLQGTLPAGIGNLVSLEVFKLSFNGLNGEIPTSFFDLTNLTEISITEPLLGGQLPESLGNLANLKSLSISNTKINGNIPVSIGDLVALETLSLPGNQFSGQIPASIGALENLKTLGLNGNNLSGTIPVEIGKLIKLESIRLSENGLIGNIPTALSSLVNLMTLSLSDNNLSGNIPQELGKLAKLTDLQLHSNHLTGNIPQELGDMSSLFSLNLQDNQLTGELPESLGKFKSMQVLVLNDNQLSGKIPESLANLTNLIELKLFNNKFSEGFPSQFRGNIYNVFLTLDLHENQLSALPDLTNLSALLSFDVSNNNLSFDDILPNITRLTQFIPQDSIGESAEVSLIEGDNYTISLGIDEEITNNEYLWFKDGVELKRTNDNELVLENLSTADAGIYTCQVTNSGAPGLTLNSRPVALLLNAIPKITSTPVTEATKDTPYVYNITATDADGDVLTFSASTLPSWLTLTDHGDGTATLGGSPKSSDCADNQVVLTVNDGKISSEQSFEINMDVTMTASIQVASTTICKGTEASFTVELTNAGSNPKIIWEIDDNPVVGMNSETFTTNLLSDGDVVSVDVTIDPSVCITNTTAHAEVAVTVIDQVNLDVNLTSDKTEIASGETVNFLASTDYSASPVQFEWFINDELVEDVTNGTFSTNNLENNDEVKVKLKAEPIPCLEQTEVESKVVIITVNDIAEPPTIQNIAKTTDEDVPLAFVKNDFASALNSEIPLVSIRITALPTRGHLTLKGDQIAVNQEIPSESLSGLKYIPDPDTNGEDSFMWNGSNGIQYSENEATVQILIQSENDPPAFNISGNVIVLKNFSTVESVTVTPEEVPADELGQTVTYQLVPASVSFANLIFDPQSGRVSITSVFDESGKQEFEIIANDGQATNNVFIRKFVLEVGVGNGHPPNDIAADNLFIAENQPRGTVIGTITVSDEDPDDRHVLNLIDHNTQFFIDGNQLKTNAVLDFEVKASYEITVQATDLAGNVLVEPFTITVTDENDLPTQLRISANEILENAPSGTLIGSVSALDQDQDDILVYNLVSDVADNAFFSLVNGELTSNSIFDFEEKGEYEIVVRVDDGNEGILEERITIFVLDVEPEEIEIVSGFTPDHDRMNDTWEIPGLSSYPRCTVAVYNSWGQQVFFSRGYAKPWDGTYQNRDVPVGTYYYVIEIDNGQPSITGNIAVMR